MFSVTEFPDQKSINVLDEFGTIKNLGRFAIGYSSCSSFTALSGNSDLQLHSQNQTEEEDDDEEEHQEGAVEDEDADSTDWKSSGSSEESEGEEEEEEEEKEESHREPIDHLLKVKHCIVLSTKLINFLITGNKCLCLVQFEIVSEIII